MKKEGEREREREREEEKRGRAAEQSGGRVRGGERGRGRVRTREKEEEKSRRRRVGVASASRRVRFSREAGNEREAYVAAARNGVWGRFQRPGRKSRGKREAIPFPAERTFEWCARRRLPASGPTGGSGSPDLSGRGRGKRAARPRRSIRLERDVPSNGGARHTRQSRTLSRFYLLRFSSAGWRRERERERERESCERNGGGRWDCTRARDGGDTEPKGGRTTPLLKMATCSRTGCRDFMGDCDRLEPRQTR